MGSLIHMKRVEKGNNLGTNSGSTKGLLYGHVASRSKLTCRERNKKLNRTKNKHEKINT